MSVFDVSEALPSEWPVCRALLPRAFPAVAALPQLSVVRQGGEVVGVSALSYQPAWFALDVAVREDWRRRGVGRALARAGLEAADGETVAVRPGLLVFADEPAHRFCVALGFSEVTRYLRFEVVNDAFRISMGEMLRRYARKIPPGFAVVPVREAPRGEVLAVAAASLGVVEYGAAGRFDPQSPEAYDLDLSPAVLVDGKVVAVSLLSTSGDLADFDVIAVAEPYRAGPAQLMLLEAACRMTYEAGFPRWRFSCEEHVAYTVRLAARMGAASLPIQIVFEVRLAS